MMTATGINSPGRAGWNPWRRVVANTLLFESYSDQLIEAAIASANTGSAPAVSPGSSRELGRRTLPSRPNPGCSESISLRFQRKTTLLPTEGFNVMAPSRR